MIYIRDDVSIAQYVNMFVFIKKIMNDYHFIVLNFVVLISYMQIKTQKMCECQNINFNKNALVFFSSNYINWIWLQHICENCIFNIFSQQSFVFSVLYFNEFNLKFSCKFFQRCNFFNDVIFSAMRILEFSQRCIVWNFRANFFNDVNFVKLNYTSMRKLQKRTNRNSMIYWFQI